MNHTSQSYDVQNTVVFFGGGGEKNKCQKRIKVETQHKYEMTSCESEILDGLIYYICIEQNTQIILCVFFICLTSRIYRSETNEFYDHWLVDIGQTS